MAREETAFAQWLRKEMAARGFGDNQSKLATYMGVRSSTVNRWFTIGGTPKPEMAAKLARALQVPVEDVLAAAGVTLRRQADSESNEPAPGWVSLIPLLSREDQDLVGRFVEQLVARPGPGHGTSRGAR